MFLDFKKAFDLVNHKVLLDKIGLCGGIVETVNWFGSYLSERRQGVPLGQGVPQGSIVGSILFVLFINDLRLHVINSDVDIYADDSTITFIVQGGMLRYHLWRKISMKTWIRFEMV